MRYWCPWCCEEAQGYMKRERLAVAVEVPDRFGGGYTRTINRFVCRRCGTPLGDAGTCIYCGEACDPEADPELCYACREDLEEVINRLLISLLCPEGSGEPGDQEKIDALYALAVLMDAKREELERKVKRDADRRKAEEDQREH